jgi:protein-S-isoprenylcysteine O-methyltransferase Ste14
MLDFIAFMTIILWPVIPLFWIPVHGLSRIFKKLGLLTFVMPLFTWLPLAYFIFSNKALLLSWKIDVPSGLRAMGFILSVLGTALHIWTGKLLGLWGLIGLPEISRRMKGHLITKGPFSIVRHPTYLAHTMIFSGVFLITGAVAVGFITFIDVLLVYALIIPLEEKELSNRFGNDYNLYKKKVPKFLPGFHF